MIDLKDRVGKVGSAKGKLGSASTALPLGGLLAGPVLQHAPPLGLAWDSMVSGPTWAVGTVLGPFSGGLQELC